MSTRFGNFMFRLNGLAIAYVMAVVNSLLAVVSSFGIKLSADERASLVGFVNAALILAAHVTAIHTERHLNDTNGAKT